MTRYKNSRVLIVSDKVLCKFTCAFSMNQSRLLLMLQAHSPHTAFKQIGCSEQCFHRPCFVCTCRLDSVSSFSQWELGCLGKRESRTRCGLGSLLGGCSFLLSVHVVLTKHTCQIHDEISLADCLVQALFVQHVRVDSSHVEHVVEHLNWPASSTSFYRVQSCRVHPHQPIALNKIE